MLCRFFPRKRSLLPNCIRAERGRLCSTLMYRVLCATGRSHAAKHPLCQPLHQCGLFCQSYAVTPFPGAVTINYDSVLTTQHLSHMFCTCVNFVDFSDFVYKVNHPSEADDLKRVLCSTFASRNLTLLALATRFKKSVSYGFCRVMFLCS